MGLRNRSFLLGALAAFLVTACAGLTFAYHFYGLELASYASGVLLGPEPKDDLPMSVCAPDVAGKGKCIIMLGSDFYAMKQDYEDTKQALKDCQAPK